MRNTIRNIAIPLGLVTLGALTIKDYLEDSRVIKFGTIKEGNYRLAKYHVLEDEDKREIKIYQRNNNPVYEEISITAIDEKKDGIYEEINVNLKGKDTSRVISHIPSDLENILKEINSK